MDPISARPLQSRAAEGNTPMDDLKGTRIAVLVVDGFEQVEMTSPRDVLREQGAEVVLASEKRGRVQGFNHHDRGDSFEVDATFDDLRPQDFEGVLLPGGVIGADAIRTNETAQRFVRGMNAAGKIIAVICHGPWLLISAGLVGNRRMTSYHTLEDDLTNAGAEWVDEKCVRDRNWVSSRQPDDLPAFTRELVRAISEVRSARRRHDRSEDSGRVTAPR